MKLSECYDQQIEALLDHDYDKFCKIIDETDNYLSITSHGRAWNHTSDNDKSLFSYLPGAYVCASQIEYYDVNSDMKTLVLKDAPIKLPDFSRDDVSNYEFSREELEEFKRRQLLARSAK